MRKRRPRRIMVLFPHGGSWIVPVLGGIRLYAHTRRNWHLFTGLSIFHRGAGFTSLLADLRQRRGDAFIVSSGDPEELRFIRDMGLPAVNLSAQIEDSCGIPRVIVDDVRAGQLAAEHLLSRGLKHLAFFGMWESWFASQRCRSFQERAAKAGVPCNVLPHFNHELLTASWKEMEEVLARWLISLPRPVGIFAEHDYSGQLLMEACNGAGLRIPEDVAVIGIDYDESVAEHSYPPLSSISCNPHGVGWEAAALLDRLMHGEPALAGDILIEPGGVIERASTDRIYASDPVIQAALDYMRNNLVSQFNIEQLAESLGVSKRTLETRFRAVLQRSPHDYLTNLRVQRAQVLLKEPRNRTIEQTACECGFVSARTFRGAFRRTTGESFAAYRRKHRADGR